MHTHTHRLAEAGERGANLSKAEASKHRYMREQKFLYFRTDFVSVADNTTATTTAMATTTSMATTTARRHLETGPHKLPLALRVVFCYMCIFTFALWHCLVHLCLVLHPC